MQSLYTANTCICFDIIWYFDDIFIDIFIKTWNCHRIRGQCKQDLPTGVPDHMLAFPELMMVAKWVTYTFWQIERSSWGIQHIGNWKQYSFRGWFFKNNMLPLHPIQKRLRLKKNIEAYRCSITKF